MKIIGGKFKGRILKTPKGLSTRPTQSMLREAVFNICQNEIEGAHFLDLFAGSGAIGFEALSRGAFHSTLVEKSRWAIACIHANIASLQLSSSVTVIHSDAKTALRHLSRPFDIVYIDPPYDTPCERFVEEFLTRCLLKPNGFLFIELRNRSASFLTFASLSLISRRHFGDALLYHFQNK